MLVIQWWMRGSWPHEVHRVMEEIVIRQSHQWSYCTFVTNTLRENHRMLWRFTTRCLRRWKMAFFFLSAADFHFEKEKEPGSFSFLPTSRSACVHTSIPIPGLPFSWWKNCLCSCLSPILVPFIPFSEGLIVYLPFLFHSIWFSLLHYSCQHANTSFKKSLCSL